MNRANLFLYGITLIIALVIVLDFTLPGEVFTEQVTHVAKKRQQYYNAGGNQHYSYSVITSKHQFSVAEDFAKSVAHKEINYSVSLLFKEINSYRLLSSKNSSSYSFRILSGLILPLIVMGTILIAYVYKKRISVLLFVLQILLLGDLILLVL